jgi:hypothetical protein
MFKRLLSGMAILAVAVLTGMFLFRDTVAPVEAQAGWTANYYSDTSFATLAATVSYPTLNLNFGEGPPVDAAGVQVPNVGPDNFSARFTSTQSLAPGNYTLTISVDDRARVLVNNIEVFNITVPNTVQSRVVSISGPTTNFVIEYVEFTSVAFIQFQITPAGGGGGGVAPPPGGIITPTPNLTPTSTPLPTATFLPAIPPGALTATVINAGVLNARQAPTTGAPRVARLLRGQTYQVLGRDPDARWFLLQLSGFQGWSYGFYLFINGNEFNAPVVSGNALFDLAGQPDYGVRAQTEAGMRMRAAPTTTAIQNGRIDWGAFLPVIGRTPSGLWWKVVWKGTVGWVYSPFLRVVEGDIRNVPIEGA